MKAIWRPAGWGIGVPLLDEAGKPLDYARVEETRRRLQPTWMQTWTVWSAENVVPNWEFATGELDETALAAIDGRTVLLLNEPETGRVGQLSPVAAAVRTCEAVEYLRRKGIRFNWIAPNSNINGRNFDWLASYADALMGMGYVPHLWGIHVYGRSVGTLNHHWNRFLQWYERSGERRHVLITEGGAGGNASVDEHKLAMSWLRSIMQGPVVGVAYFASHAYREGTQHYRGVLDDADLMQTWSRLR